MNMGENEILRDYHEAKDKFRQVRILAEQNLMKPKEMAQWLKDHGETVDRRYFSVGKTPAKVTAIERGPVDVNGIKNARAIAEMMDSIEAQPVDQSAKADAGKPRLSLVPPAAVEETAKVREYGCRKYRRAAGTTGATLRLTGTLRRHSGTSGRRLMTTAKSTRRAG